MIFSGSVRVPQAGKFQGGRGTTWWGSVTWGFSLGRYLGLPHLIIGPWLTLCLSLSTDWEGLHKRFGFWNPKPESEEDLQNMERNERDWSMQEFEDADFDTALQADNILEFLVKSLHSWVSVISIQI